MKIIRKVIKDRISATEEELKRDAEIQDLPRKLYREWYKRWAKETFGEQPDRKENSETKK